MRKASADNLSVTHIYCSNSKYTLDLPKQIYYFSITILFFFLESESLIGVVERFLHAVDSMFFYLMNISNHAKLFGACSVNEYISWRTYR